MNFLASSSKNFLYFPALALKIFPQHKFLILFPKKTHFEKISYILENRTFQPQA